MPTSSERLVLDELGERPYFSVRLIPNAERSTLLPSAKNVVEANAVSVRGWSFPRYHNQDVHTAGNKYAFSTTTHDRHVELWRVYRSLQFLYVGATWDGPFQDQHRRENERMRWRENDAPPASLASFVGLIYSITEFVIFASRFASALVVDCPVTLKVALHNIENVVLVSGDESVFFHNDYRAHSGLVRADDVLILKAIDTKSAADVAKSPIRDILGAFDWAVTDQTIESWQQKLLRR